MSELHLEMPRNTFGNINTFNWGEMYGCKVCSDTPPRVVVDNLGHVSVSYVPLLGTPEGKKVMSPATEESLRLLLQKYNSATDADPAVRAQRTRDIAINSIRQEMIRRLEMDEKYYEARVKLEELPKEVLYL